MLVTNPTEVQTDLIPFCCAAPCFPCVFQKHVVVLMMPAVVLQSSPSSAIQKVVSLVLLDPWSLLAASLGSKSR